MTFADCTRLASTGFADSGALMVWGLIAVLLGIALVSIRSRRRGAALLLVLGLGVSGLALAPSAAEPAFASTCSSGKHSGGSGGDTVATGPCTTTSTPSNPVLGYSGQSGLWFQLDYTSLNDVLRATDCDIQLNYYEDQDTDHSTTDLSTWTIPVDLWQFVGDPIYNPSAGILQFTPNSGYFFVQIVLIDHTTGETVATYDSNVFQGIDPNT